MRKLQLLLVSILFLTGCGEMHEIQHEAYAVGMGVDYVDGEYKIILQFLDFSNVAKSDQNKSEQPGQVFLGIGQGKTIEDAISVIRKGTQLPINFDQINIFIFGKSLLEHGLMEAIRALDSNFEIRLTGMAYGTVDSIEDIFTAQVPFNYPYTSSRIVQPEDMQEEDSTIPPLTLQELIYQMNEKIKTVILPSVKINNDIMKEGAENMPVTTIGSAFLIKDMQMMGNLKNEDLIGYIRVNQDMDKTTLTLKENESEDQYIQIEIAKSKLKRSFKKDEAGNLQLGLNINIAATVHESSEHMNVKKIKNQLIETLTDEIYQSYINSQQLESDVFQLEEFLYRYHHNTWKTLMKTEGLPSLRKEDINITIKPFKTIHKSNYNFLK